MKYIDEFRSPQAVKVFVDRIKSIATQKWVIMEICGGQTHSIMKNGLHQLLDDVVELVHGPGCPVCVTPLELIDQAIEIASLPHVIFTSFGDMLRVPGSSGSLLEARSRGADVRMVYSPLEALKLARAHPDKEVVFFAVGFETTAPGNAMAVFRAKQENLQNFSELVSHVLVPPAMTALLASETNRVQAYLAAGHVCAVMGWEEYVPIAEEFNVPIVVTGFEPMDLLKGIWMAVQQLEAGRHEVENAYPRAVARHGNAAAKRLLQSVFDTANRKWRGIGILPQSGWELKPEYALYDAARKFKVDHIRTNEPAACISGQILQGIKKPNQCPAFGSLCTPEHPLGATMVSGEGACSAYYRYHH